MNADKLLNAIGEIDDSLVQQARTPHTNKKVWQMCTAAACAAIVMMVGLRWPPWENLPDPVPPTDQDTTQGPTENDAVTEPPVVTVPSPESPAETRPRPGRITVDPELPVLQVQAPFAGQGFESLETFDILLENTGNPWTADADIEELPVYKNLAYTNRAGEPLYLTESEMDQLAQAVADASGETAVQTEKAEGAHSQKPSTIYYATPSMEISVSGDGMVIISFQNAPVLPAEHQLTADSTQQALDTAAAYLQDKYRTILELAGISAVTGAEYRDGKISFCQRGEDLTQTLQNYWGFACVSFTIAQNGQIEGVRLERQQAVADQIGMYPVISVEEAETLLLEGSYLSTVWESDLLGGAVTEGIIGKAELVYRTGSAEETFLPYYRFWLEMSGKGMTWLQEGEKCYGAFYVPSVHPAYLEGLPLWDGNFN